MSQIIEGAVAPLFEGEAIDGRIIRLERYADYQRVLLYLMRNPG